MGTIGKNAGSQQMNDGQKNYQNSNERNRDHARSNTEKHRYEDHDELTNDQKFQEGKPQDDMDFRDKLDNLEDQDQEQSS